MAEFVCVWKSEQSIGVDKQGKFVGVVRTV